MAFIHPFDDPDVIAGQGSVGLELLAQVPDLSRVIVPVGGGGLISGIAIAVRSKRPEIEVIGVQVEACAPFPASLQAGVPVPVESVRTIADGIAVKRPGELTLRADQALGPGHGARLRRRGVRGDGVPARTDQARRRGRRCRRGCLAAGGQTPAEAGHNRDRPVGRECRCRAVGRGRATARDPAGPQARRAGDAPGSPGDAGASCSRSSGPPEPIWWTCSTSARGSTCTSGRPPSSWCWRRVGRGTLRRSATRFGPPATPSRRGSNGMRGATASSARRTSESTTALAGSASGCH